MLLTRQNPDDFCLMCPHCESLEITKWAFEEDDISYFCENCFEEFTRGKAKGEIIARIASYTLFSKEQAAISEIQQPNRRYQHG